MQSYMLTNDQRLSTAVRNIKNNYEEIDTLVRNVKNLFVHIEEVWHVLIKQIATFMHHDQVIGQQIKVLTQGVYDLVNGKLTPAIIPVEVVHSYLVCEHYGV